MLRPDDSAVTYLIAPDISDEKIRSLWGFPFPSFFFMSCLGTSISFLALADTYLTLELSKNSFHLSSSFSRSSLIL